MFSSEKQREAGENLGGGLKVSEFACFPEKQREAGERNPILMFLLYFFQKSKGKQEKILKELEKKMTWEKDKADKLLEGLKEADDENKTLKKVKKEKDG